MIFDNGAKAIAICSRGLQLALNCRSNTIVGAEVCKVPIKRTSDLTVILVVLKPYRMLNECQLKKYSSQGSVQHTYKSTTSSKTLNFIYSLQERASLDSLLHVLRIHVLDLNSIGDAKCL